MAFDVSLDAVAAMSGLLAVVFMLVFDQMRYESFTSEWEKAYWTAVLAVETNTLKQNIIRAECEIFKRLQQLSAGTSDGEERRALMRASKALAVLRTERLAA